ncbi:sensor histidine kinase [Terrihabitans sp. B22-R8]|uniref:sensor histidine kinase n=1 Tax=Terrihabitans sp. B22-R8 TaxID=3425128 RepID=UPI00403C9D98
MHTSALSDARLFARHRTFIASHLAASMMGFAIIPLFLILSGGHLSALAAIFLTWLVVPLLVAMHLSRTGRLQEALAISIGSLCLPILAIAALSGGVQSSAMIVLPFVIFETASRLEIEGARRAGFSAAIAVMTLLAAGLLGVLPVPAGGHSDPVWLLFSGAASLIAIGYACFLAKRLGHAHAPSEPNVADRYDFVVSNSQNLVTVHHRDGSVISASAAATEFLGVEKSALLARGLFDRVHVSDRPAFLTAISDVAVTGEDRMLDLRLQRAVSGLPSHPQFVLVQMRCRRCNQSGEVVVVARDISAKDAAALPSDEASKQAEAVKNALLANVSHELRTPLNAIIGFSELLTEKHANGVDPKRREEYAELIHDSGLHLLSVVNGILDMSRIESGNFTIIREPLSIKEVIDGCVQLFELKAATAGVTVVSEAGRGLPAIVADKRACKQILINLLSNAIKFTPPGGRVRIEAREMGGQMRVEVSDTGIGVSAEDLPRLGTSFFQACSSYERPFEGTGIGLSVVKGLVALHGGRFDVQSRVGAGTRIIIDLPLNAAEPQGAVEAEIEVVRTLRAVANG